jgi:hypothetical protein
MCQPATPLVHVRVCQAEEMESHRLLLSADLFSLGCLMWVHACNEASCACVVVRLTAASLADLPRSLPRAPRLRQAHTMQRVCGVGSWYHEGATARAPSRGMH